MIISNAPEYFNGGCTVALGTFDGVHLGHRAVISAALEYRLPVVVVTSAQNPQCILGKIQKSTVSSVECNDKIFQQLGVSAVIRLDFSSIKDMSPENYLDMLKVKLNAKNIVFGFNFRFGKFAAGNAQTARKFCSEHGLGITVCDEVCVESKTVSSSRIRECIANGDMNLAQRLLGRPYSIDFEVVHGDARGRTMGIPTANQQFPDDYVLPKFAVYASKVVIDGRRYASVTNVGKRPTFLSPVVLAETYIDNYSGSLYGEKLTVEFTQLIRDEVKFESIDALKEQILDDIKKAKRL